MKQAEDRLIKVYKPVLNNTTVSTITGARKSLLRYFFKDFDTNVLS